MRLRWPSHTKKPKNTTYSKQAELPKDKGKRAHFQRHKIQALEVMRVKSSKNTAELLAGREVLRAGSISLKASFTVSLLGDDQGCVCFVWFLCLWLGWFFLFYFVAGVSPFLVFSIRCRRMSYIHDCYYYHDERSTGAKKKRLLIEIKTYYMGIFCRNTRFI